jgi:H+/Cl- antiporter ClcA
MSQADFFTLYFATIGVLGGFASYVISHLMAEIKRLNERVDEIYNILLER